MCESCVARIFTLGPAPCPICGRQLRRNKFRAQTFSDVHIEREIDTRRRLQKVFNKTETDFEDLRQYNDYLEDVELITFNLTQGVDVEETERKVKQYEAENKASIQSNEARSAAEHQEALEAEEYDKQIRAEQARLANETRQLERMEQEERNAELLSAMESGADYEKVKREIMATSKARIEKMKQRQVRPQPRRKAVPFSPMMGAGLITDMYSLQLDYPDPFLNQLRQDKRFRAGGGNIRDIYERALFEAFAGLSTGTSA